MQLKQHIINHLNDLNNNVVEREKYQQSKKGQIP